MKTKNLLVLILVLGLSFNAFSQERITIKQVIKNKSTNASAYGDGIKIVQIWSSLPISIKSGKENAIYLTGDMKENEKEKLSSFCELKNNIFSINSPYLYLDEEGKAKDLSDFTITLELADDVYTYFLKSSSNVIIKKDIISDESGTFNLWGNAQISLEGEVKFGVLNIFAQEGSKIRFNSINATAAILDMGKGSVIDFNGRVRDIEISNQGEGSKLIGDYTSNTLMTHHADITDINDPTKVKRIKSIVYSIEDDLSSEGDTISKKVETKPSELSSFPRTFLPKDADVVVGKNTNVRFLFAEGMSEDYISNYPIKGSSDGKIVIQDDYPLELVVTLRNDIGNLTINEGANVIIDSEINEKERSYYLAKDAKLTFEKKSKFEDITLDLNNNSKVIFKDLVTDQFSLQGEGHSELEINGEIETLRRYKYDDINITGKNKIGSIKEKTLKTFELNIPYVSFSPDQQGNDISKSKVKSGKALGRDKVSVSLVFNYGGLKWSKGGGRIDDLFSSPGNEYALNYCESGGWGMKFNYKPTKKIVMSLGFGMEFNSYNFANNVMMTSTNGYKRLAYETNPAINAESKLKVNYFTIPLHVQYFFYKRFSIHAGGELGINFLNSSTGFQREYDITNATITEKWGRNYDNFKPLKFDIQAGFGWQAINLYAKYSLTPLFKDNKEVKVYPFSIGISLGI